MPDPIQPELQQAIESPFAEVRTGAVSALERLLHSSDKGQALAARQALTLLVNDDSRRVSAAAARALRAVTTSQLPPPKAQERLRRLLSSVPTWVWAVVGVAAVVLFIVLGQLASDPGATEEPMLTQALAPGHPQTRSTDDMVMVYVPGGTFQMGSAEGDSVVDSDEFPQHTVTLDDFWIDQTEVTNAQYVLCVADGRCSQSRYADDTDFNGDDYPVVGVLWYDAADYCAWAGAQLPTEAQWEYAARGPDGYIYPWGNDAPTCELAQFSGCPGNTVPVGSLLDGASWCDALDMAGNVWEWTSDWHGDYPSGAQTNPTGPTEGDDKVLRGGGWFSGQGDVRASYRRYGTSGFRGSYLGFRCVVQSPGQ